jgi:hypothetical protein
VRLLASILSLLYVGTTSLVALRMLLLAAATRRLPELLLGAGGLLICGVGFPISVAAGFGGPVAGLNAPLWVGSELATQAGVALLYLFTQQVFRPGVAWARALVAGVALYLPAALAGAASALSTAAPGESSVAVTRGWLLLCFAGYAGCFVWSAAESLREHAMARRRQAIGLADPIVVNRFYLWSGYGLAATGIMLANTAGVLLGVDISSSLVVLVPSGVLGLAASVAMYLVFVPPAWYLERIRA